MTWRGNNDKIYYYTVTDMEINMGMFRSVFGFASGPARDGSATEFSVRGLKWKGAMIDDLDVKISPLEVIAGDPICIVFWKDKILSIPNLRTGIGVQYRYADAPYWKEVGNETFIVWAVIALAAAIVSAVTLGSLLAGHQFLAQVGMFVVLIISIGVFLSFGLYRVIVTHHNVKIANEPNQHMEGEEHQ